MVAPHGDRIVGSHVPSPPSLLPSLLSSLLPSLLLALLASRDLWARAPRKSTDIRVVHHIQMGLNTSHSLCIPLNRGLPDPIHTQNWRYTLLLLRRCDSLCSLRSKGPLGPRNIQPGLHRFLLFHFLSSSYSSPSKGLPDPRNIRFVHCSQRQPETPSIPYRFPRMYSHSTSSRLSCGSRSGCCSCCMVCRSPSRVHPDPIHIHLGLCTPLLTPDWSTLCRFRSMDQPDPIRIRLGPCTPLLFPRFHRNGMTQNNQRHPTSSPVGPGSCPTQDRCRKCTFPRKLERLHLPTLWNHLREDLQISQYKPVRRWLEPEQLRPVCTFSSCSLWHDQKGVLGTYGKQPVSSGVIRTRWHPRPARRACRAGFRLRSCSPRSR